MAFPRSIDARGFSGVVSIPWAQPKSRHLSYDMKIEFSDRAGGHTHGVIRVCLRNCIERRPSLAAAGTR